MIPEPGCLFLFVHVTFPSFVFYLLPSCTYLTVQNYGNLYLLLLEIINLFLSVESVACYKGGFHKAFLRTVIYFSVLRPTGTECVIMMNLLPVCSPSETLNVHAIVRKVQYVNVICF